VHSNVNTASDSGAKSSRSVRPHSNAQSVYVKAIVHQHEPVAKRIIRRQDGAAIVEVEEEEAAPRLLSKSQFYASCNYAWTHGISCLRFICLRAR